MSPPRTSPAEGVAQAYETWGARLVLYAVAVAGARDVAEDAVHAVFAHLAARPHLLAAAADPAAYLFASVRREARGQRRRRLPTAPVTEDWLVALPGTPLDSEDARDVERAVGDLPEEFREAVSLRVWGGLTYGQMEEATGVPAKTLESRFRAALERLRIRLKGHA